MTKTLIASDDSNPHRTERAAAILDYCRVHTGEPLTVAGIAQALGRSPGRSFSLDLARARHMALDNGEELTNASADSRYKAYVLYHLFSDAEEGKALTPLITASRQTRTRVRNMGRHGEWLSRHGENPMDRDYGSVTAQVAGVAEQAMRLAETVEKILRDRPQL